MQQLTFELDYAFRPTPDGFLAIPEEFHAGLLNGSLELVLRRCVTPNRWTIVQAVVEPSLDAAWPLDSILERLDESPDLALFVERDCSRARVDYGPHMAAYIPMASTNAFSDAGKPLWTRYAVNAKKVEKLKKRRAKAVQCAATFNAHAGKAACAVEALSNEALAVLCLQHDRHGDRDTVWMHRALANPVLEAVKAGHAVVTADGAVESPDEAVANAKAEWKKRELSLTWEDPEHIRKRIEALRSHPRAIFSSFKGKYPDTDYGMRDLY